MAAGDFVHAAAGRSCSGWRVSIAALAIALIGAASTAAGWHEEHAGEEHAGAQDCAACHFGCQPAADLAGSISVGPVSRPAAFAPELRAGWSAPGRFSRLPARAPPV